MGRPGIGKTTMLREAARVLADDLDKRVVVVDTSNEIAGDGDIPHPAIGKARRMQVRTPSLQHEVMIEAVENHMPQVIVIDEIGTELEAQAARTIAERGVQLIGTAHGNNLDNLMLNPTLSDLIGGIQSVTLGDEEARRRRTQKSVLERKAPPTFDVVIEIQDRERVLVHADVAETVDAMLRGDPVAPSCAGATTRASIARSRGRARRRASSSRPSASRGSSAPAARWRTEPGWRGDAGYRGGAASAAGGGYRPGSPGRAGRGGPASGRGGIRVVAARSVAVGVARQRRGGRRRRRLPGSPWRGAVRGRRHRRSRPARARHRAAFRSRGRATPASCRASASGAIRPRRRSTR